MKTPGPKNIANSTQANEDKIPSSVNGLRSATIKEKRDGGVPALEAEMTGLGWDELEK